MTPGNNIKSSRIDRRLAERLRAIGISERLIYLDRGPVNAATLILEAFGSEDQTAVRVFPLTGAVRQLSVRDLRHLASRFAHLLVAMGIRPGDRVAGLLPRDTTLPVVLIGCMLAGAVYQPLFTAFGPKAIAARLAGSQAKLVVTDVVNHPKLEGLDFAPVLVAGNPASAEDLETLLAAQPEHFEPVRCFADDPMLMMFTSGTTGTPKGVSVPIRALLSFVTYMRGGMGLLDGSSFWNLADPGWAYGLYYGVIGALLLASPVTFLEPAFSVEGAYELLRRFDIEYLAGAPTAYRRMAASTLLPPPGLKMISSAGEPLDVATRSWLEKNLEAKARDHFGQTELGMVICDQRPHVTGSDDPVMGLPLPGFYVTAIDAHGIPSEVGETGRLAVDRRSPLYWFSGYIDAVEQPFFDTYYLTGDLATHRSDGCFQYVGRADDVITSSGYRISPTEVENALLDHPSVIEAAVVGISDSTSTERVKAFVVLIDNAAPSPFLADEIRLFVKSRLAAHAAPREIEFVAALPKTESGKIQRHKLRSSA